MIHLDPLFWKSGWRVGLLCQFLGIGKRTFARVVQNSLGITAKKWLRQVRIVIASHMLREGRKISPLAKLLGFAHDSDFTREFKILFGITPSVFVKLEKLRSGEIGPSIYTL